MSAWQAAHWPGRPIPAFSCASAESEGKQINNRRRVANPKVVSARPQKTAGFIGHSVYEFVVPQRVDKALTGAADRNLGVAAPDSAFGYSELRTNLTISNQSLVLQA